MYNKQELANVLKILCAQRNQSMRQASLSAQLDQAAISRITRGTRPEFETCLKLEKYFDIKDGQIQHLAGYDITPGIIDCNPTTDEMLGILRMLWPHLSAERRADLVDLARLYARQIEQQRGGSESEEKP